MLMPTAIAPPDLAIASSRAAVSWIQLVAPSATAITLLEQEHGIPSALVCHALDQGELARVDKVPGTCLIILRVPQALGKNQALPYTTVPLGIILTQHAVVTVCPSELSVIPNASELAGTNTAEEQRSRFVLLVLEKTAAAYLHSLHTIEGQVDAAELRLQRSLRNSEVLELLKYQKSLTHFTTALKLNSLMLGRLQNEALVHLEIENALLENVRVEMQQALEMTQIASDILSQMMDAFASIISNNLNVVMKFLTAFTIVLTFPTMVASFYGMNVVLPLQDFGGAFLVTLAVSLLLSLVAGLVFWRKGWL